MSSVEFRRDIRTEWSLGHHVGDPRWSHIDSHGHEHRFVGDDLPTLEIVVTGKYWCAECRDEHEESEWRCRICGDVVEPHFNFTGPISFQIPGLWEVILDGEPVPVNGEDIERIQTLHGEELLTAVREIAAKREP